MRITRWAVAATVAAALWVGAAPAQAGTVEAVHPDGSWTTVSGLHDVAVCDHHADGHKTYARIWMWYDAEYFNSGYDTYGRDHAGRWCFHFKVGSWGIFKFATCVQYEGCSAWKRT
jgi:hypothetical protein